jgi:uncharacterized membrane protein
VQELRAPINPQSVGTQGGCNPVYRSKRRRPADVVIIQEADIAARSRLFGQQ